MRGLLCAGGAILALAGCGTDPTPRPVTVAPVTVAPVTVAPVTVAPVTVAPGMGVPVTTTAAALVPVVIGTPVGTVDAAAKTPLDQGMGEADTAITQALRRAVVADNTLSVRGQNVIIITKDRSVTLRGVVASAAEQAAIAALAQKTPGVSMVYDQMQTVQQ